MNPRVYAVFIPSPFVLFRDPFDNPHIRIRHDNAAVIRMIVRVRKKRDKSPITLVRPDQAIQINIRDNIAED